MPAPFQQSVVFISIDIEALESRRVREVGVTILDTEQIKDIAPGQNGEAWMAKAKPLHFLVANEDDIHGDYRPYHSFVQTNPNGFQFGKTVEILHSDMGARIRRCFEEPFGEACTGRTSRRNLVFVGHDVKNDIKYLKDDFGFDPSEQ